MPPKADAPMRMGSRPMRPVCASGKASAAKLTKWISLSLPSGVWGICSRGQSIATVNVIVMISVREMSSCFGILEVVLGMQKKGKARPRFVTFMVKYKQLINQELRGSNKLNV